MTSVRYVYYVIRYATVLQWLGINGKHDWWRRLRATRLQISARATTTTSKRKLARAYYYYWTNNNVISRRTICSAQKTHVHRTQHIYILYYTHTDIRRRSVCDTRTSMCVFYIPIVCVCECLWILLL